MTNSICYCGTQFYSDDCFCDDCNGVVPLPVHVPDLSCMTEDVPNYEHDTPYVVNN